MVPYGNDELVNLGYLRSISQDEGFIREMIRSFLDLAPEYVGEMQAAGESCDWSGLSLWAHKLKPSATYMGIKGLLNIIQAIELQCKSQPDSLVIGPMIRQVQALCEEAYPLLRNKLSEP